MLVASVISIATDCDHDSPQALLGLDQAMRIGRLLHWKNHIDDRSDLSVFNHLFERQQLLSRFPSCDLSNAITVIRTWEPRCRTVSYPRQSKRRLQRRAAHVAGQLHPTRTSSRTKCNRITFGRGMVSSK